MTWQCVTPGCRRAKYTGETCGTCAKAAQPKRGRPPQDIHRTVYPTGETRRADGQDQVEYTDGRQTWWTHATEAAA